MSRIRQGETHRIDNATAGGYPVNIRTAHCIATTTL